MGKLRPDVATMVERANAAPPFDPATFQPDAAREMLRSGSQVADIPCPQTVTTRDIQITGPSGELLPLRLYQPQASAADQAVVVFFHGGGWIMGDLDTHHGLCGAICEQTGLRVVATHYRRAPENRFPSALDDCTHAARWVASQPDELGAVDALVFAGDSAGGNMAAACALMPSFALPVLAFWCMYASFEMDAIGGSMEEFAVGYLLTAGLLSMFRTAYFSDPAARRSPAASPLLVDDLSSAPPALIFANEFDPLRDQSRAFAARLAAAGRSVRYREAKGHVHGSMCRRALAPSGQSDLAGCIADLGSLMLEARQEQARCGSTLQSGSPSSYGLSP